MTSTNVNLADRVLGRLPAGYPTWVPGQDHVGLLRRTLTDVEVHQIAAELAGPATGRRARAGRLTTTSGTT